MAHKFFHFSLQQFEERKAVFDKLNKDFTPGTVVYNGSVHEYTAISDDKILPRYSDAQVVAEGEIEDMVYTEYKTKQKGMR